MRRILAPLCLALAAQPSLAGPYDPPAGAPGSTAIHKDDPAFTMWANAISLVRGPVDLAVPQGALASYGLESDALGPADADADLLDTLSVVSLGDGGIATLEFPLPIADKPGPDFAVFENSFTDTFLELAFVEVSSDGLHFARFPAVSRTPLDTQVGSFAGVDATDIHNLAGKFRAGFGTPFDLTEIRDPRVNTAAITHVRIVDVVGAINPALGTTDHRGVIVNDPYPTPFPSSGFDLDGVGVTHPAPTTWDDWCRFYFNTTDVPPTDDPDGDGLPNFLEWALWRSPLAASPGCELEVTQGQTTLRFRQDSTRRPASIRMEASDDLVRWTPLAADGPEGWHALVAGADVVVTEGSPDHVALTINSGVHRFFRLATGP